MSVSFVGECGWISITCESIINICIQIHFQFQTRVERRFGSRANAQRLLQSTVLSRDVVDNLLTEMDLPLSIRQKQILWQKCGGDGGVVGM